MTTTTYLITPVKSFIVQALRFQPLFCSYKNGKYYFVYLSLVYIGKALLAKKPGTEAVAMLAMASLGDTTTNGIAPIEIVTNRDA